MRAFFLVLLFAISAHCRAEDQVQAQTGEPEKAVILEIGKRFISTGTTEQGSISRSGASSTYSGSSDETGYSVIVYTLRLKASTVVAQLDPRSTAAQFVAGARWFTKDKKPDARVGDTVFLIRDKKATKLLADGKTYSVSVVRESLSSEPQTMLPVTAPQLVTDPAAVLRSEFNAAPVLFLQKRLRLWTPIEVEAVAGAPIAHRSAYDRDKNVIGDIFGYNDPSRAYELIECRFDKASRKLLGLYAYPPNMTWEDCRRTWGGDADVIEREDGGHLYSYRDRRLMVLADKNGRVVNLSIY